MDDLTFNLWLGFGIFCVLSELLLPGLVMVFVGLGSLTVVLTMHLGYIHTIPEQFTTFFISSIFYLVTLRFLVLRLVPINEIKTDIDEDRAALGSIVTIIDDITPESLGRIEYSESTWQAKADDSKITILSGDKAKVVGRENITWIVQKL